MTRVSVRTAVVGIVSLVLSAVAACGGDEAADAVPGAEQVPEPPPAPDPLHVQEQDAALDPVVTSARFSPVDGERAIRGDAVVRRLGGSGAALELYVRIEGVTGELGWNVHRGSCAEPGSPVAVPLSGPGGTAPALRVGEDGLAERTVPLPPDELNEVQLSQDAYSVRIREGGAVVACADIGR